MALFYYPFAEKSLLFLKKWSNMVLKVVESGG